MNVLPSDFNSDVYLGLNADVAMAVESGTVPSAEAHFLNFAEAEGRQYKLPALSSQIGGGLFDPDTFRYPYQGYGALPNMAFATSSFSPFDGQIGDRIIAAWRAAERSAEENGTGDTEGMWAGRLQSFHKLNDAVRSGDGTALVRELGGMFQSHITHGLAMGRSTALMAAHAREHFSAAWTDRLVRLAEALGLAAVRSAEQGGRRAPLTTTTSVAEVEEALGFELTIPAAGAPFGVLTTSGIVPEQSLVLAYAAWRLQRVALDADVAEIGGGFGGLAWYMRGKARRYTIYDLPFTCMLQAYILIKGGLAVALFGEPPARYNILPWWTFHEHPSHDVVVNQDSIPEMPRAAGTAYVASIKAVAPVFVSINQEAAALNTYAGRQLIVPELVAAEGGYVRRSRDIFWLRDGYVEEVYDRTSDRTGRAAGK